MTKQNLIDKLTKIYPYSRAWFSTKKESTLWAMLLSYVPPKKKEVVEPLPIKKIDGIEYIRTDSGLWEPIID